MQETDVRSIYNFWITAIPMIWISLRQLELHQGLQRGYLVTIQKTNYPLQDTCSMTSHLFDFYLPSFPPLLFESASPRLSTRTLLWSEQNSSANHHRNLQGKSYTHTAPCLLPSCSHHLGKVVSPAASQDLPMFWFSSHGTCKVLWDWFSLRETGQGLANDGESGWAWGFQKHDSQLSLLCLRYFDKDTWNVSGLILNFDVSCLCIRESDWKKGYCQGILTDTLFSLQLPVYGRVKEPSGVLQGMFCAHTEPGSWRLCVVCMRGFIQPFLLEWLDFPQIKQQNCFIHIEKMNRCIALNTSSLWLFVFCNFWYKTLQFSPLLFNAGCCRWCRHGTSSCKLL